MADYLGAWWKAMTTGKPIHLESGLPTDMVSEAPMRSSGVANMSPNGATTPVSIAGINAGNRWAYDNAIKAGYSEADAIAVATGGRPTQQPVVMAAPATPVAALQAPAAPQSDYDRWLNDPQIAEARRRLSGLYSTEESRANPYSFDSPAFRSMVEAEQNQARAQFAPGAQQLLNSMSGMGATSGGIAGARAAYAGGAAKALADIATSASQKQYENQQAYEDRRRQAMASLASGAANIGLGVTGQGIGATSAMQGLREQQRQFDVGTAEGRRQFDANLATRKDEFAKTYALSDRSQRDQLALAYSQLSQQAKQFADQLDFSKATTLSAEDQFNLGVIQSVAQAGGMIIGGGISAMKAGATGGVTSGAGAVGAPGIGG